MSDPSKTVCKNNTQSRNLIAFVDKNKAVKGILRTECQHKRLSIGGDSEL
jgi:hypothetical protein